MGFTKLDQGILQSSVMAEDCETFKIWITLLAACGSDGIARISPVFLESICRIRLARIMNILEKLASPDPMSRTKTDEGRRIRLIDGGFQIINYQKYRDFTFSGAKEAERKRKYRERKLNELHAKGGTQTGHVPNVLGHSASASSSVSSSEEKRRGVEKGRETKKRTAFTPPTIEEVRAYCEHRSNGIDAEHFVAYYTARGWKFGPGRPIVSWKAAVITWEKRRSADDSGNQEELPIYHQQLGD